MRSHPPVPPGEWERAELLAREKEALGLYVSSHPLADVRDQLARRADMPLASAGSLRDGQVVTVGGLVTSMQAVRDQARATRWPSPSSTTPPARSRWWCSRTRWRRPRQLLVPDAVVMVKGRADRKNEGEVKLVAFEIAPFEATADFGVVRLRLDARETPAAVIDELKSLIGEFPGDAPVVLEVRDLGGAEDAALRARSSRSAPTATSSPRRRRCSATPR